MKYFSRRDFVHAGCTVVAAVLTPSIVDKAEAYFPRGFVATTVNNNRVTLNARTFAFINLTKSWNPAMPTPNLLNANGYPNGTLGSNFSSGISLPGGYYGQYVWQWTGSGAMQLIGQVAFVYSGGANVSSLTQGGGPAGSGYVTGNFNATGSNANIVFKFGTLVSSVSGGSGSLVTITTVASLNFGAGLSTGSKITFNQGCSSNLVSGPNSDGSWTITNVSGTQFTLNNSTGIVSPTVTGTGGVGTQTEAILGITNPSLNYNNGATFSSFGGLLICTQGNLAAATAGQYWDPVYIAQVQQLKGTPGGVGRSGDFWLRFMDLSAVIGSYVSDFSQRLTPASACWVSNSNTPVAYYGGALTNGGASGNFTDVYTVASNPTNSPASGPPIDCEIIQGTPGTTNAGGYPAITMASGTRASFGTWPIFDGSIMSQILFRQNTLPTVGVTLSFTFSASWLNGGVAYTGFTYTTVTGDNNAVTFNGHLQTALAADAVLKAAKIVFFNPPSGQVAACIPTALAGPLTITYTSSGASFLTMSTLAPSAIGGTGIGTSGVKTFIFNALLGGFIYNGGTFTQGVPIEVLTQLCNLVGGNCWYNYPVYTKASYITSCTNLFASAQASGGLAAGLKFGVEVGNENWNIGTPLYGMTQCFGIALGLCVLPYGNFYGNHSWQGLQTVQYSALSRAAWASAGRTASQHYMMGMSQVTDCAVSSNFDLYCNQGQFLVTSNTLYANYAGIGGVAPSGSFNAAPNRPVDFTNARGAAPYWGSPWFNEAAVAPSGGGIVGTVAQYAPPLQASIDYANGLSSTAFAELTNQFNGTTPRSSGASGAWTLSNQYNTFLTQLLGQCAQYDNSVSAGVRYNSLPNIAMDLYEGGPQWAMGANFPSGVNSASSLASAIAAGDITALVNQMTAQGWTTTQLIPYTISGTGNLTEVATNILQMAQGWKYDTDINGNAVNSSSYLNYITTNYYNMFATIVGNSREFHACEYDGNGSQWGLTWSTYNIGGAFYQNYYAMANYNA